GVVALGLALIQIGIGTQIRQFIDLQIDFYGLDQAAKWLNPAPFKFYFHRSFSILVVLINGYLFYALRKMNLNFPVLKWVLFTLICEVLTGILMYYLDFPFASQPLHLLLASLLFGAQLYFLFQLFNHHINLPKHDL
ncbi:MAG: COX15/CtaA family protein, partial [Flavobacteriaceae bacterium]|nr:COX15/CtaA family protein [Flavobacteriaceae bacterium]